MNPSPPPNTPTDIERSLTMAILQGRYAPGSRLPTVRELAASFEVNPATVQRAVARLEARGLITARQGSGLRVNDVREVGDVSLLPCWLEALRDEPARAARVLGDFLEVRRVLAARLLARHRERLVARAGALAEVSARFTEAALGGELEATARADLEMARALLAETGNMAALALLNTVARTLEQVPEVAEAMYGDPTPNLRAAAAIFAALDRPEEALTVVVEEALAEVDRHTTARFQALLESSTNDAQEAP